MVARSQRRLRKLILGAGLVLAAGWVILSHSQGQVGSPQPPAPLTVAPGSTASQTDPLMRGNKVALGVNLAPITAPAIESFAHLIGAQPRIVMWFQQWSEPLFYSEQMDAVMAANAIPMITWDPMRDGQGIPLSEIAAGEFDSYIRGAARAASAFGGRIYIRLAHEMNLPGAPFGVGHRGDTPETFVSAWRHVVDVFRQQGATNVEWVWAPNTICAGACPFTAFYPGDAWVDWVALDGYNYSSVHNDPWETFAELFGPSYAILTRLTSRPVMIGETGTVEDGGNKADWFAGMGRALATQFTRVRAVVWFQRDKEGDWRVDSSPASLDAFRTLVHSSLFQPKG